jgi:hypothetical protein
VSGAKTATSTKRLTEDEQDVRGLGGAAEQPADRRDEVRGRVELDERLQGAGQGRRVHQRVAEEDQDEHRGHRRPCSAVGLRTSSPRW